jgi:hypothetical protein
MRRFKFMTNQSVDELMMNLVFPNKFGLPYLPVAVHVSLLSCKATGKPKYSRQLEANEYDVDTTFHFTEIK